MRHQLVAGPDPNDSKLSRLLLRSDTISNFSTQGKQFPSIEAGSGLVFDRQLGVSPSHRTSDANSLFSRDALLNRKVSIMPLGIRIGERRVEQMKCRFVPARGQLCLRKEKRHTGITSS